MSAEIDQESSSAANGGDTMVTEQSGGGKEAAEESAKCPMPHLSPKAPTDVRCSFGHALFRSDLPESPNRVTKDKNVKKMLKLRETRRNAGITHVFFPLECEETNLSETFWEQYQTLLNQSSKAIECYHIVTNSLTRYFSDKTWSNSVEDKVASFIKDCVLQSHEELCKRYDSDETDCHDRRLLEYEVSALLEMHVLRLKPKPLSETDLACKIRFLNYTADWDRMKRFIDEGITDLFSLMLPLYVTGLHEELSLDIPCDLEEFESAEHKMAQDFTSAFNGGQRLGFFDEDNNDASEDGGDSERSSTLRRSLRGQAGVALLTGDSLPKISRRKPVASTNFTMSSATALAVAKLHEELETEENEEANDENSKIHRRRSTRNLVAGDKRKSNDHKSPPDHEAQIKKEVLRTPTRAPKKPRKTFVPETPDEKLRQKKREEVYDDEVVKQTPAGKIRNRRDKDAAKYRELLKQAEASAARSEARVKSAFNSPALSGSMSGTPVMSRRKLLNNSPAKATTPASTSVRLRSSAKVNLRDRFAALQQESSSSSASPKPKAETSSKFGITADIIDGYSDKMNSIYKNASKLDSDTIFYGRNATHENLFQKEEEESAPMATSRRTQQKNRSGRSVNPSSICVNMAHVLLNVDNDNPLSRSRPQKQESPFKMKKLLRHHTSTRKRAATRALLKSPKKVKIDPDAIKQEEVNE